MSWKVLFERNKHYQRRKTLGIYSVFDSEQSKIFLLLLLLLIIGIITFIFSKERRRKKADEKRQLCCCRRNSTYWQSARVIETLRRREIEMSKQQQRTTHEPRTYEFWGGRPLKRTASDLFLDRPRPTNMVFSGTFSFLLRWTHIFLYSKAPMLCGINVIHLVISLVMLAKVKHQHFDHSILVT